MAQCTTVSVPGPGTDDNGGDGDGGTGGPDIIRDNPGLALAAGTLGAFAVVRMARGRSTGGRTSRRSNNNGGNK